MHVLEFSSGVITDDRHRGLDSTECAYNLIISISDYEYQHRIFFDLLNFLARLADSEFSPDLSAPLCPL